MIQRVLAFAGFGALMVVAAGCDQIRIRHTSTHVEPPEQSSAFVVGSAEQRTTFEFRKVFPVQVDWDTIRDSPLTFNPFNIQRGERIGVRVAPGERNLQVELRLRRSASESELYAGTTLTFRAELGKSYVVRADDLGDKAKLWVADAINDAVVSDVATPTLGKPPPGMPRFPIIIYLKR